MVDNTFFFRNIVLQAENEREKDEVMEKLLKVFFVFKIVIYIIR